MGVWEAFPLCASNDPGVLAAKRVKLEQQKCIQVKTAPPAASKRPTTAEKVRERIYTQGSTENSEEFFVLLPGLSPWVASPARAKVLPEVVELHVSGFLDERGQVGSAKMDSLKYDDIYGLYYGEEEETLSMALYIYLKAEAGLEDIKLKGTMIPQLVKAVGSRLPANTVQVGDLAQRPLSERKGRYYLKCINRTVEFTHVPLW